MTRKIFFLRSSFDQKPCFCIFYFQAFFYLENLHINKKIIISLHRMASRAVCALCQSDEGKMNAVGEKGLRTILRAITKSRKMIFMKD